MTELQLVDLTTGDVVHRVPVRDGTSQRVIDLASAGLLAHVDRERFCVRLQTGVTP